MIFILLFSAFVSWLIFRECRKRTSWIIAMIGYQNWYRYHYLVSPSWRFARWLKLSLSGRRCKSCGSMNSLDVHHETYRILGYSVLYWEWLMPWILEVLCREHHKDEHGFDS